MSHLPALSPLPNPLGPVPPSLNLAPSPSPNQPLFPSLNLNVAPSPSLNLPPTGRKLLPASTRDAGKLNLGLQSNRFGI